MKHWKWKALAAAASLVAAVSAGAQSTGATGGTDRGMTAGDSSRSSGLASNPRHDECEGLTTTALRDCLKAREDRLDAAGAGAMTPTPGATPKTGRIAPSAGGTKGGGNTGNAGAASGTGGGGG